MTITASRLLLFLALVAMLIAFLTVVAHASVLFGWEAWTSLGFVLWLAASFV